VSFSFSYRELIITGLVGALLAFLASRWKVPGVLLGALSPMASAMIMAIVKAYSSGAAMGGPRLPGLLYLLGAFWWVASLRSEVRRAILLAGLHAGLASTAIGASVVVGTTLLTQKDPTCLVWGIGEGCQQTTPFEQPPGDDSSPAAVSGAPHTADDNSGNGALVAASLLVGSGILSAAILRRRG